MVRRYRRQDEIGTPYCITVDFETANDKSVTVRDRDTMQQERIKIDNLLALFKTKNLFMFEAFSYPNGLKSVISKQLGTKAVTVLVMVKVGSRFESKNLNGISHFTEHLMFKGTKRRPSTLKISHELRFYWS